MKSNTQLTNPVRRPGTRLLSLPVCLLMALNLLEIPIQAAAQYNLSSAEFGLSVSILINGQPLQEAMETENGQAIKVDLTWSLPDQTFTSDDTFVYTVPAIYALNDRTDTMFLIPNTSETAGYYSIHSNVITVHYLSAFLQIAHPVTTQGLNGTLQYTPEQIQTGTASLPVPGSGDVSVHILSGPAFTLTKTAEKTINEPDLTGTITYTITVEHALFPNTTE